MKSFLTTQTDEISKLFELSIENLEKEIINKKDLWIEFVPLGSGAFRDPIHSLVEYALLYPGKIRIRICKLYRQYLHDKSENNRLELFNEVKGAIFHIFAGVVTKEPLSAVGLGSLLNYLTTYAIKKTLKVLCKEETPNN